MPTIGKVLENWVVNGTFPSTIEFGRDIVADRRIYSRLVPDKVISTLRNVYSIPRGILWTENDVEETYDLSVYYDQATTGASDYDMVSLDKQFSVGKFYNLVELKAWLGDGNEMWSFFNLGEAERIIDLKMEKANIDYIKANSTAEMQDNLVVDATTGEINAYKTLLNCQTQLIKRGVSPAEILYYVSPDFYQMLMTDGIIIANGQSSVQSMDVREGLTGQIRGKGDGSDFIMTGSGIAITPSMGQRADKMLLIAHTIGNLWLIHNVVTPLQFVNVGLDVHRVAAIKLVYVIWFSPYIIDKNASGYILDTRNNG